MTARSFILNIHHAAATPGAISLAQAFTLASDYTCQVVLTRKKSGGEPVFATSTGLAFSRRVRIEHAAAVAHKDNLVLASMCQAAHTN